MHCHVFITCVFRWEQLQKKLQDTVQNMIAGELGSPLIARYPFLVPAYLSAGFNVIKGANPADEPKLEQVPYAIHFLYGLKYTSAYDMEFAFPVDIDKPDGFDVLLKAIHIAVDAVADAAKPGKAGPPSTVPLIMKPFHKLSLKFTISIN